MSGWTFGFGCQGVVTCVDKFPALCLLNVPDSRETFGSGYATHFPIGRTDGSFSPFDSQNDSSTTFSKVSGSPFSVPSFLPSKESFEFPEETFAIHKGKFLPSKEVLTSRVTPLSEKRVETTTDPSVPLGG